MTPPPDDAPLARRRAETWLAEHDVRSVQVNAMTLQGTVVGKRLATEEFLATLPDGVGLPDTVLHQSVGGDYAFGWQPGPWAGELRDVQARPDVTTLALLAGGRRTAGVLADLHDLQGDPLPVCPRSTLERLVRQLRDRGFEARVAFELEGTVFEESYDEARSRGYADLHPLGSATKRLCNGTPPAAYVEYADAVTDELDRTGVPWTGWVNEGGLGQLEINFPPLHPVAAADAVVRARSAMRTVAERLGRSATFMALPARRTPAGLHLHLSLWRDGDNAFAGGRDQLVPLLSRWVGGLVATMPAATSFAMPNPNSYRRLVPGHGAPTAPLWGRHNKTVALRVLPDGRGARFEHRLPGADANPYLVLAAVLAGGLAGMDGDLAPPPEFAGSAWGLPPDFEPQLPATLARAAHALESDEALRDRMGELLVRYWLGSRRWEWYVFHTAGGDPHAVTEWERRRYFEGVA